MFLKTIPKYFICRNLVSKLVNRKSFQRNCSRNLVKNSNVSPSADPSEWILFYRFRHILVLRFLTRVKIYQTGISTFIAISSIYHYNQGKLDLFQVCVYNGICLFAIFMLVLIGNLARRVIGIAYYHRSNPQLVKLAHMSFWGKRTDRVFDLNQLSPLSDTNLKPGNPFLRLEMMDGKNHFWLSKRHSNYNKEKFSNIFGDP